MRILADIGWLRPSLGTTADNQQAPQQNLVAAVHSTLENIDKAATM